MSDLQVALIILGVLIIAAVVVYNWMQERKLRNKVSSDFIVPQKDVLADDFHINVDAYIVDKELAASAKVLNEPSIVEPAATDFNDDVFAAAVELQAELKQSLHEKLVPEPQAFKDHLVLTEPIVQADLHGKTQSAPVDLPEVTHAQIDLSAILYFTKNVTSQDLGALTASLADIGLPLIVHGRDGDDQWQALNVGTTTSFKQVACSLQLADRGGPIAKSSLNKFQFAVEAAGLDLNAHVEWQGSGDALQRAIELDQFCIEVDQMISVHIAQAETAVHNTKFRGLAEASGMRLQDDGKFHFYANELPLFTVTDTNNVPFTAESLRSSVLKSVTFQIEIPKVTNCEQAFNQMITIAHKMANSLNASLVDDNQKPLGDIQIEKIRQQLKIIHAIMVARGIMPGSPSSLRLFS